jgi:hypothetical protein
MYYLSVENVEEAERRRIDAEWFPQSADEQIREQFAVMALPRKQRRG